MRYTRDTGKEDVVEGDELPTYFMEWMLGRLDPLKEGGPR